VTSEADTATSEADTAEDGDPEGPEEVEEEETDTSGDGRTDDLRMSYSRL
jgi:hypothetical protein